MAANRESRLILRSRNRLRWGDWTSGLRADLERLIALMDQSPTPVYLVGGLGLAVRSESFYRNHGDIDLAIDSADLPQFSDFLATCDYRVTRAVFGLNVSPWHRVDLTRPWAPSSAISEGTALRIQHERVGAGDGRTGLMDLLPFTRVSGGLQMHGYGTTVPVWDFFPAEPLGGSKNLMLPNTEYKWHLPRSWRRQRHDLAVLTRV